MSEVEIKTNTTMEVHVSSDIFQIEFEPYRSQAGHAGIGVYMTRSLQKYPGTKDAVVASIKEAITAYAKQKKAELRFE